MTTAQTGSASSTASISVGPCRASSRGGADRRVETRLPHFAQGGMQCAQQEGLFTHFVLLLEHAPPALRTFVCTTKSSLPFLKYYLRHLFAANSNCLTKTRQRPGLIDDVVLSWTCFGILGALLFWMRFEISQEGPTIEVEYAHMFVWKTPRKSSANPKKPGEKSKAGKESAEYTSRVQVWCLRRIVLVAHSPTLPLFSAMQCFKR